MFLPHQPTFPNMSLTCILNFLFSYTDNILTLNQQIESMSEKFANKEAEAIKSIGQWKEKLGASHQEKAQLETDLEEAESKIAELNDLCSKYASNDTIAAQWEERANELSNSVAVLEDQLKEQEQEALDAVEQWQSACSDLELKCSNLELEIKGNRETISSQGWSIEQLRSSNENYETQINNLKSTDSTVESSLRENLASAKAEIIRLEEVQEDDRRQFQAELEAEKARSKEANENIKILSSNLEEINTDSKDTVMQWTGKHIWLFWKQWLFV